MECTTEELAILSKRTVSRGNRILCRLLHRNKLVHRAVRPTEQSHSTSLGSLVDAGHKALLRIRGVQEHFIQHGGGWCPEPDDPGSRGTFNIQSQTLPMENNRKANLLRSNTRLRRRCKQSRVARCRDRDDDQESQMRPSKIQTYV